VVPTPEHLKIQEKYQVECFMNETNLWSIAQTRVPLYCSMEGNLSKILPTPEHFKIQKKYQVESAL